MFVKSLRINRGIAPLIFLALSAASLGFAYVAEYGFDLKPCVLCLYQRIPYAVVIGLSIIFLAVKRDLLLKSFVILCLISFLSGTGIASYHFGVEQKWWLGTEDCGRDSEATTIEELRKQIMSAPTVRCDEIAFTFLGISMTGWNLLWSLFLASLCLYFLRIRK